MQNVSSKKVVILTGPIRRKEDPIYKMDTSLQIPLLFFKVILFEQNNQIFSTAFIMSHEKRMRKQGMFATKIKRGITKPISQKLAFKNYIYKDVYQVNIDTLQILSGLNFTWENIKPIQLEKDAFKVQKLSVKENSSQNTSLGMHATQRISNIILPY